MARGCAPGELIGRVINLFGDAHAIYVYGGSLDCSGGDVDVAVFTNNPPVELPNLSGVDLQVFKKPRNTLFFAYVVETGLLVHGKPLHIDVNEAVRNEVGKIGERVLTFRNSDDEVMVCKSLKELMFLLAALRCGLDGSSNWYRMSHCLMSMGIETPLEFKNCLSPPSLGTLRTIGEPVLNRVINELTQLTNRLRLEV
jgi:hypothetical protein